MSLAMTSSPVITMRIAGGDSPAVVDRVVRGPLAAAAQRLDLNPRGRLVMSLFAVGAAILAVTISAIIVAAVFMGGATASAGSESAAPSGATQVVTVSEGESLWSVAARAAPGADPRDVMTQIIELNGLGTTIVQPGQELAVPSSDLG